MASGMWFVLTRAGNLYRFRFRFSFLDRHPNGYPFFETHTPSKFPSTRSFIPLPHFLCFLPPPPFRPFFSSDWRFLPNFFPQLHFFSAKKRKTMGGAIKDRATVIITTSPARYCHVVMLTYFASQVLTKYQCPLCLCLSLN